MAAPFDINISPNHVINYIQLNLSGFENGPFSIRTFTVHGTLLHSENHVFKAEKNTHRIDVRHFPVETYYTQFRQGIKWSTINWVK